MKISGAAGRFGPSSRTSKTVIVALVIILFVGALQFSMLMPFQFAPPPSTVPPTRCNDVALPQPTAPALSASAPLKMTHVDKLFRCNLPATTLYAMKTLMFLTADVFNGAGVLWWLDSGSIVGPMRANALLPWDDDGDIFIDADDFYENREAMNASVHRRIKGWGSDMVLSLTGWWGPGKPSEDRNWHQCPGGSGDNIPRMILRIMGAPHKNGAAHWHTAVMDIFLVERISPRSCQIRQTCREPWVFSLFLMSLFNTFHPSVVSAELQKELQVAPGKDLCVNNGSILVYKDTLKDLHVPVPNLRPELSLRKFSRGMRSTVRIFERCDFPIPHDPNAYLMERFHSMKKRDYANEVAFSGVHDMTLAIDFAEADGTPRALREMCCSWGFLGPDPNHPLFSGAKGHCPEAFVSDVRHAPEIAAKLLISTLKAFHFDGRNASSVPLSKANSLFDPSKTAMWEACRQSEENRRACEAVFAADPMVLPLHDEIFDKATAP